MPRGVANAGGIIADNQNSFVSQVLKLAHLAKHNSMAKMNIRACRVKSELYAELTLVFGGIGKLFS